MKMEPLILFQNWYKEELQLSTLEIPSACCLSSMGLDGFPNARFVSLKLVRDGKFIVSGPKNSRKGLELMANPKAALTFWWTSTQRQVRIQGLAATISDEEAEQLFTGRGRDSQIVSQAFEQGHPMPEGLTSENIFSEGRRIWEGQNVIRPAEWGGFAIDPVRLEFMEFKASRLHHRELFEMKAGIWVKTILQP